MQYKYVLLFDTCLPEIIKSTNVISIGLALLSPFNFSLVVYASCIHHLAPIQCIELVSLPCGARVLSIGIPADSGYFPAWSFLIFVALLHFKLCIFS